MKVMAMVRAVGAPAEIVRDAADVASLLEALANDQYVPDALETPGSEVEPKSRFRG